MMSFIDGTVAWFWRILWMRDPIHNQLESEE